MKKIRTREEILDEIAELEEELDEFEDEEELEEYRKRWRRFAKQLQIMQEELDLPKEKCLEMIQECIRDGRY